jgi:glycosyltransferase involved in cell wall biosynthesis
VIPVYNEQDGLERTIQQMESLLKNMPDELEIVFVDDGSTDGTCKVLADLKMPGCRIRHHRANQGYGAAIKTGLKSTTAPYICITDADGTYPNLEIPKLADFLDEGFVMIVGSRSGNRVRMPLMRRVPKWVLNKLANYLTGTKIPDINSGLRIIEREALEHFIHILPDGFSFTTTITLAMLTNHLPVHFEPIDYHARQGTSKIRPVYDTLNFLQLIVRTCLYFNPLKVFVPLSFLLILGGIAVLILSWLLAERLMDVTFGVMVMASVVVLAIGLLADLIDKRLP